MKAIARVELTPGMVLGEDVVLRGAVIMEAGDKLTASKIDILRRYSIMCVTVLEDVDFAETHFEKLRYSEEFKFFENKHNECLLYYKNLIEYFISSKKEIPSTAFMSIYNNMKTTYSTSTQLLDYIYNLMPNADQLTFNHCLNSALLGGLFSEWLHLNEKDTETLVLSCFYYDIGKLMLPYQVLWKPDRLTQEEYELVKKHPVLGYSIVNNNTVNVSQSVKNAIIMHHERMNGSGYPYHMRGEKIDIFARYIGIIDTYIAMASPRSYRNAFTPLQIVAHFEQHIDEYDASIVIPLITHIADSQVGMQVQLSDDSVWNVFIINPANLSRPILKDANERLLNLAEYPELSIVKNL